MMLLQLVPHQALMMSLIVLVSGQTDTDSRLRDRAYVVLEKQNLVTMCSVLAILLLFMVIMAVCVYKPLTRPR
ncbi:hypothetical protein JOB18_001279 [Solea senegalensis]|uniref:Uncharacterized protein n=1 Tax=Solea senegalensis TaxID=28829 RepID=A0AAV6QD01_SOLSE|nr:hypothetical protein JOB18_001279 [Solea senegalensis]